MKLMYPMAAGLAVAGAVLLMAGCQADPSAPSRPKAANLLQTPENSTDNAFKRENEQTKPDLPATGPEFPGHSQAAPVAGSKVITADSGFRDGSKPVRANGSDSRFPETKYPQNGWYPGPLPALAEKPGTVPMVGSTPVPGTGWSVDHSWGEGLPLVDYPHRDWGEKKATYVAAEVKHNPVYFATIQDRLNVPQNDGTYGGNLISDLYEVPWFVGQTVALPVLMAIEHPLKQVTTQRLGHDPVYLGQHSTGGAIVPSPEPGVIKWDYPFLRVNPNDPNATTQATTQPIAPTPGIAPAPAATAPAQLHEVETKQPETTPGLR